METFKVVSENESSLESWYKRSHALSRGRHGLVMLPSVKHEKARQIGVRGDPI